MIKEANKRNGSQIRARMSDNQTKKCRYSSWLIEAASYGAEPVELVPNWFSRLVKNPKFGQEVPKWLRKQTKETTQLRPRMSENQTKKGKCSSWLTEATSYGAEPVEPVPNQSRRLVNNPKFGHKVPKWLRKKTKETVLNSEPGWVRTRPRKASVPHGWQRLPAMVLNRLNRFQTGSVGW